MTGVRHHLFSRPAANYRQPRPNFLPPGAYINMKQVWLVPEELAMQAVSFAERPRARGRLYFWTILPIAGLTDEPTLRIVFADNESAFRCSKRIII